MSHQQLAREIIALSESSNWDRAKQEWKLENIYISDEAQTCLCGHWPIKELCYLGNSKNGNEAIVGNVCVNKFMGISSDKIFAAIKRVAKDPNKSLNIEAIDVGFNNGWINEWESDFYIDILRKRNLTSKQADKKRQINRKFVLMSAQSPAER